MDGQVRRSILKDPEGSKKGRCKACWSTAARRLLGSVKTAKIRVHSSAGRSPPAACTACQPHWLTRLQICPTRPFDWHLTVPAAQHPWPAARPCGQAGPSPQLQLAHCHLLALCAPGEQSAYTTSSSLITPQCCWKPSSCHSSAEQHIFYTSDHSRLEKDRLWRHNTVTPVWEHW